MCKWLIHLQAFPLEELTLILVRLQQLRGFTAPLQKASELFKDIASSHPPCSLSLSRNDFWPFQNQSSPPSWHRYCQSFCLLKIICRTRNHLIQKKLSNCVSRRVWVCHCANVILCIIESGHLRFKSTAIGEILAVKEAPIINGKLITPSKGTKKISTASASYQAGAAKGKMQPLDMKNKDRKTLSHVKWLLKILGMDQYSKKLITQTIELTGFVGTSLTHPIHTSFVLFPLLPLPWGASPV